MFIRLLSSSLAPALFGTPRLPCPVPKSRSGLYSLILLRYSLNRIRKVRIQIQAGSTELSDGA